MLSQRVAQPLVQLARLTDEYQDVAAAIARRHGRSLGELPVATPRMPVRPVAISAVADATIEDGGYFTRDD